MNDDYLDWLLILSGTYKTDETGESTGDVSITLYFLL